MKLISYVNKNNTNVRLFLGTDKYKRVISRIERDGQIVAKDMYIKLPNYYQLEGNGWVQEH